ncbi:MAG: hypothetical protein JSW34_03365 [Candidatus Zixiibacteriota bacterium]|nr:MAG: hypothetical protein JSW34_03365 [candidate division Zixibacteria bacterium]
MKTDQARLAGSIILIMTLSFCLAGCGNDDVSSTLASSANFHSGAVGDYITDESAGATAVIAGQPLHYVFDAGAISIPIGIPVAGYLTITFSPIEAGWQPDESPVMAGSEPISETGPILVYDREMEAGSYILSFGADYLPSGCYRIVISVTGSSGTRFRAIRNALLVHHFEEIPGDLLWFYYYTLCQTRGEC